MAVSRGFEDVEFRYIVYPTQPLPNVGMVPIAMSKDDIKTEIDMGYSDALKVI